MDNTYALIDGIEIKEDDVDLSELSDFQIFLLSIFLDNKEDDEDE